MSTINSITSTVVSAFQGVTPVAEPGQVEPAANPSPAFQETLTTQGRAFALGLGVPRNHGDIEAVFAEIATKFGAEVERANDFANAAQTAVRSTALAAAAGSLAFFATFNAIMLNAEANIARQNVVIEAKNETITNLEAQKAPLVSQRNALNAEYSANASTYWQNISQINQLNAQLATLEPARATACAADAGGASCQNLTSQVNGIRSTISSLNAQNAALVNRNNEISGQVAALNNEINILQGQINTATSERNAATNSRNQSQNDYNVALATLNAFAAVLIPFTVALALGTIGAGGRASFDLGPDQQGFDDAIAQAVNRLADLSDEMGNLSMLRQALQLSVPITPESLTQVPEGEPPAATDQEPVETPTRTGATLDLTGQEPPVQDLSQTEEPGPDPIPGTQPLPQLEAQVPQVGAIIGEPQVNAAAPSGQPSAFEMLRQLLANLPLPTADFLPDPVAQADGVAPQGTGPERPQNAFDVVRQLLQDMLPPAVGNAEEVASRVGELAAALTMLRGALGQVAEAESAQTPQVPGSSGRLTLAI